MKYLAFLLSLAVFWPTEYYADSMAFEPGKLTLHATASIKKPADEIQMKIGVVTIADTAELALLENSEKMQAIVAQLEGAGMDKGEYETGQFSVQPVYEPYPQNPPLHWKQSIAGYEVKNTLVIHTQKIEMAGKMIDFSNEAGANFISDIRFSLHEPRAHWNEALVAATQHAIHDAQTIASAAGVRLSRILSINLQNTQISAPTLPSNYLCASKGAEATPIEAGEVTLTANVSIVYEID